MKSPRLEEHDIARPGIEASAAMAVSTGTGHRQHQEPVVGAALAIGGVPRAHPEMARDQLPRRRGGRVVARRGIVILAHIQQNIIGF